MRKDYYSNSKDYINRWVVSYADFVTMLLALFMVMYAISQNVTKYQAEQIAKNKVETVKTVDAVDSEHIDILKKAFEEEITENEHIKLVKESRGLVVRLSNAMIFDEGSAIIKEDAQKTLNEVIKVVSVIDNPILIEGHTDSTPIRTDRYPSNWELSTARATNIISYIMKTGKITPKRLSAVGYGEYMPISDNTSSGGRMLNRRVDIIILEKNKVGDELWQNQTN